MKCKYCGKAIPSTRAMLGECEECDERIALKVYHGHIDEAEAKKQTAKEAKGANRNGRLQNEGYG